MKAIVAALGSVLLLSGCGPASESSAGEPGPSPTTHEVDGYPVTVPPRPGFVPPQPYPAEPGFENVWYGSPELWTSLDRDGAVWRDLPIGKGPHAIGDKTFWFSESFSTADGEDFSGDDDITLTAVDLDGSARTVVEEGGAASFHEDIKNFILVGLGLPEPGCWEVTATYKGDELSYVLYVEA
ncbi:MAG TPA: hypothetical protein VIG64_11685 [Actinomycetota bacterium]|jgi:hypothetical protein